MKPALGRLFVNFRKLGLPKKLILFSCNRSYSRIRKSVKELLALPSDSGGLKQVHVCGWIKSNPRRFKNVMFWSVNDGSSPSHLQLVCLPETQIRGDISNGASVSIHGDLQCSEGKGQVWDFIASEIDVVGPCPANCPVQSVKGKVNLESRREHLHLRPKCDVFSSILKVRNNASMALHNYFQKNGFLFVHTPLITSNDCEGAGMTFNLQTDDSKQNSGFPDFDPNSPDVNAAEKTSEDGDNHPESDRFFGTGVNLTVSGQLHLEVITGAQDKVYNFGPVFRAEKCRSRHHAAEFYMIEAELAFLECLEDLIATIEDLLRNVTEDLLTASVESLKAAGCTDHSFNSIEKCINSPWPRIQYGEALDILAKKSSHLKWGDDLSKEDEKTLVKHCANLPVFVTDFPANLKPFYALKNLDNNTTASLDLLFPGVGEVVGGTLREHEYSVLHHTLSELQMLNKLKWYLDIRQYGTVPHGGFGLGFERYLQYLMGISNIKDVLPFPRTFHNCKL